MDGIVFLLSHLSQPLSSNTSTTLSLSQPPKSNHTSQQISPWIDFWIFDSSKSSHPINFLGLKSANSTHISCHSFDWSPCRFEIRASLSAKFNLKFAVCESGMGLWAALLQSDGTSSANRSASKILEMQIFHLVTHSPKHPSSSVSLAGVGYEP